MRSDFPGGPASAPNAAIPIAQPASGGVVDRGGKAGPSRGHGAEGGGHHGGCEYAEAGAPRLLEALAEHAPPAPVRSLREGTRAQAVRQGRFCYDHLGGRLGVTLMSALIDQGVLSGGDGRFHAEQAERDRLSAPGRDIDYRLTDSGAYALREFGIDVDALRGGRRVLIRYCLDWSEQRHHLAGVLGAAFAGRLFTLGWIERARKGRAVYLTDPGTSGLRERFGIEPGSESG